MIRTYILTISDKAFRGERVDETGPLLCQILAAEGYEVCALELLPDERELIEERLKRLADSHTVDLILTNGGTGFSPRDVTPEATLAVIERRAPGIPEAMRLASLAITARAMLSRAEAGIRGTSLIVNLPGSPKAARENLQAILPGLAHGISMLAEKTADCAEPLPDAQEPLPDAQEPLSVAQEPESSAVVVSVNMSERKGTIKKEVPQIRLRPNWGIEGDAHAGDWHRQVSLLAEESIDRMRGSVAFALQHGIFAENINTRGIELKRLPVGSLLKVGTALLRVTQIGKACHNDGCAIKRAAGHCVMPTEGIFAEVMEAGEVQAGDRVELVP